MAKAINHGRRAEQKALKDICARILKNDKIDWLELFNDRMDLGVSNEYEKNLDSGAVAPEKAAKIKSWLLTQEPDLGHVDKFPTRRCTATI